MRRVEDLLNSILQDVHGSQLKFYSDKDLDSTAIMSHVLLSEICMPVDRLIKLVKDGDGELEVHVRWKGLSDSGHFGAVSKCVRGRAAPPHSSCCRKTTPRSLAEKARSTLVI